jgi:hypothetical protein
MEIPLVPSILEQAIIWRCDRRTFMNLALPFESMDWSGPRAS